MLKLIKRYKKGDSLTIYDGGDGKYYTDQTYSTPFAPSGVSTGSTNRTTFTDGMSDEAENGLKWGSLAGIPGAILGWGVGSIIGKIRDKRALKIVNSQAGLNNGNTLYVANTFSNENRNGKNTITQNDIADLYIQDQMNGTNIREQQAMKNAYDNTKSNYNENNQALITITKDYDYLNEDKALAKIINDRKKELQGLANTYASPMIGKSGIKIKKKNEGKFTDYCGGEVTQKCINKAKSSGNKKLVKRATFAENARKWKHLEGGKVTKEMKKQYQKQQSQKFLNKEQELDNAPDKWLFGLVTGSKNAGNGLFSILSKGNLWLSDKVAYERGEKAVRDGNARWNFDKMPKSVDKYKPGKTAMFLDVINPLF